MPLVTIACPEHPAEHSLLQEVADAVAAALGLGAGDVIAMTTPVRSIAMSGHGECKGAWPIATIHGSDRGEAPMRTALAATERAILDWGRDTGTVLEGVWTEWAPPLIH